MCPKVGYDKVFFSVLDHFYVKCSVLLGISHFIAATHYYYSKLILNFNSLSGRKIFRKSDLTLAEERKPDLESYVKRLIKLPPKISQSNIVMSFFKRKQSDPEWFQQFPQGINRQGDTVDIIESKDSTIENTVKESQHVHVLQGADLLYEDDSGLASYLNPSFEASGSLT